MRSIRLLVAVSSISCIGAFAPAALAQQPPPPPPPGSSTYTWSTAPTPPGVEPGMPPVPPTVGATPDPGYDTMGTAGARAVGLAPPGTRPGDFMDTRLSWTFGDDDFLHPTGQLIPLSPSFSIGDRPQYRLFFDNLNSRYAAARTSRTSSCTRRCPAFIPGI
jgi:hypothetical protein